MGRHKLPVRAPPPSRDTTHEVIRRVLGSYAQPQLEGHLLVLQKLFVVDWRVLLGPHILKPHIVMKNPNADKVQFTLSLASPVFYQW